MKHVINHYLRKFGVELHGSGYLQSLSKGEFKKDAFEMQKELIGKAGKVNTIFDVGANRGDIIAKYLEHYPHAAIHAFEPFPGTFEVCKERFAAEKSVRAHSLAVSNEPGKMQFYVNKSVDTNSLLKPAKTGLSSDKVVENQGVIEVQTTTIDLYCEQNNISHIDILKMDIQGGELNALKGAERMLSNSAIGLIYSEAYFIEQYEFQPLYHDIATFLYEYGFCLQDIYNPIYGKQCLAWADVIFIKKLIKQPKSESIIDRV